jgi:hypothetical protein
MKTNLQKKEHGKSTVFFNPYIRDQNLLDIIIVKAITKQKLKLKIVLYVSLTREETQETKSIHQLTYPRLNLLDAIINTNDTRNLKLEII